MVLDHLRDRAAHRGVPVAALLSLATASFSLYSGLAAPLAIAIGLMLIAGLTLLPALLAICGPVAFWPSSVKPGAGRAGWWGPACSRIVRRPLATLAIGLVVFCALAVASAGYLAAGSGGAVTGPAGSDSAAGDALLTRHFPQTAANPTIIVLRLRQPAWAAAALVATAERQLAADPVFTSVSGPLNANGTALTAAQYAALYAAYGPARAMAASAAAAVPRAKLAAYQSYRANGSYVSADGYTISFATSLRAGSPVTTAAAQAVPAIRAAAARAARAAGASASGVTGQAAFTYDVAQLSDSDLRTVIPIAIAVIAVLLALVMRSLIAPLYLILSVVLSYFSALGLTVLVFIKAAGQPGLTFILPFLLFMFLLALGEDYNILVMTRIREEARHLPLREAVGRALSVTGTTVSSAGLVLAGTFGVLAIVGSGSAGAQNVRTIVDVGVGLALGVLMDTFGVRTLLVPSAAVLIGRWNWWPSALYRERPPGGPAPDTRDDTFTTYKLLLKLASEGHGGRRARAALADPRLRKNMPGWHPPPDSIFAALDVHMLNSDPPDHERLRRLVNKVFTARRVERLRPRITEITAGLLDDMPARGEVDLLASFAFPLPITVICELLGVPAADRDAFRTWSATIVSDTARLVIYRSDGTTDGGRAGSAHHD